MFNFSNRENDFADRNENISSVYRDAAAYKAKDLYDYLDSLDSQQGDPEWEAKELVRSAYYLLVGGDQALHASA